MPKKFLSKLMRKKGGSIGNEQQPPINPAYTESFGTQLKNFLDKISKYQFKENIKEDLDSPQFQENIQEDLNSPQSLVIEKLKKIYVESWNKKLSNITMNQDNRTKEEDNILTLIRTKINDVEDLINLEVGKKISLLSSGNTQSELYTDRDSRENTEKPLSGYSTQKPSDNNNITTPDLISWESDKTEPLSEDSIPEQREVNPFKLAQPGLYPDFANWGIDKTEPLSGYSIKEQSYNKNITTPDRSVWESGEPQEELSHKTMPINKIVSIFQSFSQIDIMSEVIEQEIKGLLYPQACQAFAEDKLKASIDEVYSIFRNNPDYMQSHLYNVFREQILPRYDLLCQGKLPLNFPQISLDEVQISLNNEQVSLNNNKVVVIYDTLPPRLPQKLYKEKIVDSTSNLEIDNHGIGSDEHFMKVVQRSSNSRIKEQQQEKQLMELNEEEQDNKKRNIVYTLLAKISDDELEKKLQEAEEINESRLKAEEYVYQNYAKAKFETISVILKCNTGLVSKEETNKILLSIVDIKNRNFPNIYTENIINHHLDSLRYNNIYKGIKSYQDEYMIDKAEACHKFAKDCVQVDIKALQKIFKDKELGNELISKYSQEYKLYVEIYKSLEQGILPVELINETTKNAIICALDNLRSNDIYKEIKSYQDECMLDKAMACHQFAKNFIQKDIELLQKIFEDQELGNELISKYSQEYKLYVEIYKSLEQGILPVELINKTTKNQKESSNLDTTRTNPFDSRRTNPFSDPNPVALIATPSDRRRTDTFLNPNPVALIATPSDRRRTNPFSDFNPFASTSNTGARKRFSSEEQRQRGF